MCHTVAQETTVEPRNHIRSEPLWDALAAPLAGLVPNYGHVRYVKRVAVLPAHSAFCRVSIRQLIAIAESEHCVQHQCHTPWNPQTVLPGPRYGAVKNSVPHDG